MCSMSSSAATRAASRRFSARRSGQPDPAAAPPLLRPELLSHRAFRPARCGRSIPPGCTEENTTRHLVEDIEALRKHLGLSACCSLAVPGAPPSRSLTPGRIRSASPRWCCAAYSSAPAARWTGISAGWAGAAAGLAGTDARRRRRCSRALPCGCEPARRGGAQRWTAYEDAVMAFDSEVLPRLRRRMPKAFCAGTGPAALPRARLLSGAGSAALAPDPPGRDAGAHRAGQPRPGVPAARRAGAGRAAARRRAAPRRGRRPFGRAAGDGAALRAATDELRGRLQGARAR